MQGDVALAGYVLTAEEWQALDPALRAQLVEAATDEPRGEPEPPARE